MDGYILYSDPVKNWHNARMPVSSWIVNIATQESNPAGRLILLLLVVLLLVVVVLLATTTS